VIPLIIDSIVSSGERCEDVRLAAGFGEICVNYKTLLCEMKDQVARVTLNRPQVLHALNAAVFDELESVFMTLAADVEVRVILLTGMGEKAFAAGADISELTGLSAAEGEAKARRGQEVFRLIETCGKPVIACINGFALGGGCELAMACTMRLASETARMGQPEVKLGLVPGYGGTQRLPRLVGRPMALKLLLTGEMIGAAEALRIGLVEEVVPADRLMERAEALARTMVGMAPLAVAGCMEAVRWGSELGLDAALDVEAEIFGRLCGTEDKAEGTKAFLEKRSAVWVGR
jgi:enoyl-CoA hydratase